MTTEVLNNYAGKPGLSREHATKFGAYALALFLFLLAQPALAHNSSSSEAGSDKSTGEKSKSPQEKSVNRPVKDKWAVVVGVSKFKDPKLNLGCSAKDADDVYNYLIEKANFKPDHIVRLTDEEATRQNLLSVLGDKWLPRVALPDDVVFIYFSSHGSPSSYDIGGVNYLLAYDTDPQNLYASGIAMHDIARIIKERVHTDRLILVLDACHSGSAKPGAKGIFRSFGNVDVGGIVHGTGQLVISSSEPKQRSWESKRYHGSVFTKYLIEGLEEHGPKTTIGDAFDFMKDKVQEEVLRDRGVLQTPVMKSKWEGEELILASVPSRPRSGLTFVPQVNQETSRLVEIMPQKTTRTNSAQHPVTSRQTSRVNSGQAQAASTQANSGQKQAASNQTASAESDQIDVAPQAVQVSSKKSKKIFKRKKSKVNSSKTSFTVTIETKKRSPEEAAKVYVVMHGKNGLNKKTWKFKCNIGDETPAGDVRVGPDNCKNCSTQANVAELPQT